MVKEDTRNGSATTNTAPKEVTKTPGLDHDGDDGDPSKVVNSNNNDAAATAKAQLSEESTANEQKKEAGEKNDDVSTKPTISSDSTKESSLETKKSDTGAPVWKKLTGDANSGLWKDRVVLVCPECLAEGKALPWSKEARKGAVAKCCFIKKSTAGELNLPLMEPSKDGVSRLDLSTVCENPTRFKNQRQAMQDHYRLQHVDFTGELPVFVRRVRSQNNFAPGTSAKEKQRVYQMNAFERKKRKVDEGSPGSEDTDGEESIKRSRKLEPFTFLKDLDLTKQGIADFVNVLSGAAEQVDETDIWSQPDTIIKASGNAIDALIRVIEKVRSTFNIEGVTKAYRFRGLVVRKQVNLNPDMGPDEISKVGIGAETFYKLLHVALESLTDFHSQAEAIAVLSKNNVTDKKRKHQPTWPEVEDRPARYYINEDRFKRMIHEADANFLNEFHERLPKSAQILVQDAIHIRDDKLSEFPRSLSPWGIATHTDDVKHSSPENASEV